MPDMNPQPEAPDETIRADLMKGFAEYDAGQAAPETDPGASISPSPDAPGEPAGAEESPPDAPAVAAKDDHPTDPNRYKDGTYKPTKTAAAPEKAAPVKPEIPSTDATKASDPAASAPQDAPPVSWTADAKAEWSKLSPALRAAVSKRETEIASGRQLWSEKERRYETVLAPVAQAAARRGMRTEDGLQALLAAQDFLERDAPSAIKWLAQNHGVNLATLAGQPAPEGSRDVSQQPDISALVRQAVAPILAPIQERMQMEERQRETSTVNLVTEFASSPGHEHFESVQGEIMALIPQVKAANPTWTHDKVLQDAYDRAVWANPTTRAALTEAQMKSAEDKRQADAKARTARARSGSVSVTGAPVGTNGTGAKGSIREELEAAFASAR